MQRMKHFGVLISGNLFHIPPFKGQGCESHRKMVRARCGGWDFKDVGQMDTELAETI